MPNELICEGCGQYESECKCGEKMIKPTDDKEANDTIKALNILLAKLLVETKERYLFYSMLVDLKMAELRRNV